MESKFEWINVRERLIYNQINPVHLFFLFIFNEQRIWLNMDLCMPSFHSQIEIQNIILKNAFLYDICSLYLIVHLKWTEEFSEQVCLKNIQIWVNYQQRMSQYS